MKRFNQASITAFTHTILLHPNATHPIPILSPLPSHVIPFPFHHIASPINLRTRHGDIEKIAPKQKITRQYSPFAGWV
jgi:hypothetical protein